MNSFIKYLKNKNLSENTLKTYKSVLKNYNVDECMWSDIKRKLSNKNLKSRTLHLHKNVLISFYTFKKRKDILNKLSIFKLPPIEMRYFEVVSRNFLHLRTKILENDKEELVKYKIIIRFLFETGIRASELFNLEFKNNKLFVLGKGNKKRQIFYVEETFANLKIYFPKLNEFQTTKTLRIYIKKIIGKKFSTHSLRRSFATHMLTKGANPKTVMLQMGHTKIETTFGYLNLNEKYNKQIYNKFMLKP